MFSYKILHLLILILSIWYQPKLISATNVNVTWLLNGNRKYTKGICYAHAALVCGPTTRKMTVDNNHSIHFLFRNEKCLPLLFAISRIIL